MLHLEVSSYPYLHVTIILLGSKLTTLVVDLQSPKKYLFLERVVPLGFPNLTILTRLGLTW